MPGLFDSFTLKNLTLKNRIMMSPMCQYQAQDGVPGEWHFVHYGSRAVGGVGLIMIEATAVEDRGRISLGDTGLWSEEQAQAFKRIADYCHQYGAKIGIQLAHAGLKAEVPGAHVAPSAMSHFAEYDTPEALTAEGIAGIVEAFKQAAVRAVGAGFDLVEVHAAHGYLLNEFLSPLTNQRTDEYGGSFENRIRLPLEVIRAVKSVLPADMPLFMRVSAVEHHAEGYSLEEMIEMVKRFKEAGVDIVDVSSGGNHPTAPQTYPGYQLQYAAAIRAQAGIPTIAVGMMEDAQLSEQAVRNGQTDLVAWGRGLLRNPHLAKQAAVELRVEFDLPNVYKYAF